MKIEVKDIMKKIGKLNVLRHIYCQKIASKTGLYIGQPPILDYILKNNGCTQREIANELQISPASIAISTKRMQRAGLLKKTVDINNLRKNQLTITKKGENALKECRKEFDKLDSQIFNNIDNETLELFSNTIDKMINNIISEEFADKTVESLFELERKLSVRNIRNMEEDKYD